MNGTLSNNVGLFSTATIFSRIVDSIYTYAIRRVLKLFVPVHINFHLIRNLEFQNITGTKY